MAKPKYTFIKEVNPKEKDVQIIQDGVTSYNAEILGERADHFVLFMRDENEAILGGISCWVHSDSIFFDLLWVNPKLRNQGFGSELLARAEKEGKQRGCYYAILDTFAFQASHFYENNGYIQIGEIKNCLLGHSRLFFKKEL